MIGKGSFGEAWRATDVSTNQQVAVKLINLEDISEKDRASAQKEARLLIQLSHPFVVRGVDSFTKNKQLAIVMEYCGGGDLSTRVKRASAAGRLFKESLILTWFAQIVLGLNYLHQHRILHRDLKTANIFLTETHTAKLGDLGIARVLEATAAVAKTTVGTPYYMSPEVLSNLPYGTKSDVWSLGCVLYEICSRRHAFEAQNLNSLIIKILKGHFPPLPSSYSPDLERMVRSLLSLNPEDRPSTSELLQQPLLRQTVQKLAARGENFELVSQHIVAPSAPLVATKQVPPCDLPPVLATCDPLDSLGDESAVPPLMQDVPETPDQQVITAILAGKTETPVEEVGSYQPLVIPDLDISPPTGPVVLIGNSLCDIVLSRFPSLRSRFSQLASLMSLAYSGESLQILSSIVGLNDSVDLLPLSAVPQEVASEGEQSSRAWQLTASVVRALLLEEQLASLGDSSTDTDALPCVMRGIDQYRFAQRVFPYQIPSSA